MARCGCHGPNLELVCEAAVSGGHPRQVDGVAAAGARGEDSNSEGYALRILHDLHSEIYTLEDVLIKQVWKVKKVLVS